MKRVAFAHLKGGVGKSTAAVNIAALAAASGISTLLADLDAQGAASYILQVDTGTARAKSVARGRKDVSQHIVATSYPNLDVLPGSFALRKLPKLIAEQSDGREQLATTLKRIGKGYKLLIVDAPAGLHIESEAILRAVDVVVAPVVPSPLAMESFRTLSEFLSRQRGARTPAVYGFFSMVDRRKRLHRETMDVQAADGSGGEASTGIWNIAVPYASVVERMTTERAPLTAMKRPGRALEAYREVWNQLADTLGL
jgi:cellulose biosynthesis protein BcsQ